MLLFILRRASGSLKWGEGRGQDDGLGGRCGLGGLFSPLRAAGSTTWGDACKRHVQSLTSAPVPSDTVGKLITASLGRLESGHNLLICACVRLPCAGVQLFGSLAACRFFCILLLKEMVVQAQALQRRIPGPSCSLSGQRQFL